MCVFVFVFEKETGGEAGEIGEGVVVSCVCVCVFLYMGTHGIITARALS